jgi:hypothetical protein
MDQEHSITSFMLIASATNVLQPELSSESDLYTLVANDAKRPYRFLGQR